MLSWFKKKLSSDEIQAIAQAVTLETKESLQTIRLEMNQRFSELEIRLKNLDKNIEIMEKKILSKDLTDRQAYGQLHYQLEELKTLRKELALKNIQARTKLEN